MKHELLEPRSAAPASPRWHEAAVAVELGEHRYLLDDGRVATAALTCVIEPRIGDRVLIAACADAQCYVVHVLSRAPDDVGDGGSATFSVPGIAQLTLAQRSIDLVATERLGLRSLKDAEIVAATGTLRVTANDLFRCVAQTVVDALKHYVGSAEHYLLDVDQLLRQHGQQVMLTADKDVKVDAERISMG